jgi:hypothetical protein
LLCHHEARETATRPHVHQVRGRRHEERPSHDDEPLGVAHLLRQRSGAEEAELARLSEDQVKRFAGDWRVALIVGAGHRRNVSPLGR